MTGPTRELDPIDARLLNRIQEDIPTVSRPFAALGEWLGSDEADVLDRLRSLKARNIVRQISAIFDTRSLGYKSSLVAMATTPENELPAAKALNAHPGVTHNYKRNHDFNIWFTVAVPPTTSLEETVAALHEEAGALSTRILPTLRLFKIGVTLDMTGAEDPARRSAPAYGDANRQATPPPLSAEHIATIRAMQDDLPLVAQPYQQVAECEGLTEEALFAHAADLRQRGQLRRVAAVLHHRKAGFRANGMAVWKVPEAEVGRVGEQMAQFTAVLPRLALQRVQHDPRPHRWRVRGRGGGHLRGDGHPRVDHPVQLDRVQEDAHTLLYAGDGGVGAAAPGAASRRAGRRSLVHHSVLAKRRVDAAQLDQACRGGVV